MEEQYWVLDIHINIYVTHCGNTHLGGEGYERTIKDGEYNTTLLYLPPLTPILYTVIR